MGETKRDVKGYVHQLEQEQKERQQKSEDLKQYVNMLQNEHKDYQTKLRNLQDRIRSLQNENSVIEEPSSCTEPGLSSLRAKVEIAQ